VIRFGLHLTLRGGREALVRLLVTAAGVAVGVGLLLATLAAVHAVDAQNARHAWLNSGVPEATAPDAVPSPDPLWATLATDRYAGARITRVDVAATGPRAPVFPGLPRLPGPGEFYASPALRDLLAAAPPAELGDRYPGRPAGTIGDAALPSPDSLVAVVGHAVDDLTRTPGAVVVATVATESPDRCARCPVGTSADGIALVLAVTAAGLLFPVLVFVDTATRLSAVRREQRFAAMRLVGATPRQVAVVAAVESTVAAALGTAAGFAAFALLRGPLSAVPLTGETFFPGDLALTATDVLLVGLGVPLAAALAATAATRRVRISPLGVTRRVTPRPPRAVRLLPLVAGLAELAWFIGRRPDTTNGQIAAYLTGILLIMGGLVVAGPWLTMVGARALAGVSRRPATLLAARRLADDPRAGFRAVSGLALALFVTSTAVGVMTTMVAERGAPTGDVAVSRTLVLDLTWGRMPAGEDPPPADRLPAGLGGALASLPGVQGWLPLHTDPLGTEVSVGLPWRIEAALVACRDLAALPDLGSCPAGAEVASVPPGFSPIERRSSWRGTRWPAAPMAADAVDALPVTQVVVGTDGSRAALERARTVLATAYPDRRPPATLAERRADGDIARHLAGFQRLADVVTVGSLVIAGCSLAVSVVAGLTDRRRPFSLLRLAGVPLAALRRALALETAVPLLAVAAVAAGLGFLAAGLFLRSQLDYPLQPPGLGYYATVLVGLVACLAVVGSTLPLLGRVTGPETARNE
jgi:hypothetical protein